MPVLHPYLQDCLPAATRLQSSPDPAPFLPRAVAHMGSCMQLAPEWGEVGPPGGAQWGNRLGRGWVTGCSKRRVPLRGGSRGRGCSLL